MLVDTEFDDPPNCVAEFLVLLLTLVELSVRVGEVYWLFLTATSSAGLEYLPEPETVEPVLLSRLLVLVLRPAFAVAVRLFVPASRVLVVLEFALDTDVLLLPAAVALVREVEEVPLLLSLV